jgi:hypothetical protein
MLHGQENKIWYAQLCAVTSCSSRLMLSCVEGLLPGEKERKEKTTPFGINSMRSQVLYRAAQNLLPGQAASYIQ